MSRVDPSLAQVANQPAWLHRLISVLGSDGWLGEPATLDIADASSELLAALTHPATLATNNADNWRSRIQDWRSAVNSLGDELRQLLAADVAPVEQALTTFPYPNKPINRLAYQSTASGTCATHLRELLRQLDTPTARAAAWDDLVAAVQAGHAGEVRPALYLFMSRLPVEAFARRFVLSDLQALLHDQAFAVASARGEPICFSEDWSPGGPAGASSDERLRLCRSQLTAPAREAACVIYTAFKDAALVGMGDDIGPVKLYDADWLLDTLKRPSDANTAFIPVELLDIDDHTIDGLRQIADPDSDKEEPRRSVLVRVDLGCCLVDGAAAEGLLLARDVVELASFRTGLGSWQQMEGYLLYADGHLRQWHASGRDQFPVQGSHAFIAVGRELSELSKQAGIGDILVSPEFRSVAEVAAQLNDNRQVNAHQQLADAWRLLERLRDWASSGVDLHGDLRLIFASSRLRHDLAAATRAAKRALEARDGALDVEAETALKQAIQGWTVKLAAAVRGLPALTAAVGETSWEGLLLDEQCAAVTSSASALKRLDRLGEDFDTLNARAKRCRDGFTHGLPVDPAVVGSCYQFARQLAGFGLWFAMESVLNGGTAREGLDKAGQLGEAFRQKLQGGTSVADAF